MQRDRPKRRLIDVLREDMRIAAVRAEDAEDGGRNGNE